MVEKVFFNDEKIEKISERIESLIKLGKNKSNSESRTSLSKSLSLKPTMFNNKVFNRFKRFLTGSTNRFNGTGSNGFI